MPIMALDHQLVLHQEEIHAQRKHLKREIIQHIEAALQDIRGEIASAPEI